MERDPSHHFSGRQRRYAIVKSSRFRIFGSGTGVVVVAGVQREGEIRRRQFSIISAERDSCLAEPRRIDERVQAIAVPEVVEVRGERVGRIPLGRVVRAHDRGEVSEGRDAMLSRGRAGETRAGGTFLAKFAPCVGDCKDFRGGPRLPGLCFARVARTEILAVGLWGAAVDSYSLD